MTINAKGFKVEYKSGPRANWRHHIHRLSYPTVAEAEAAVRSWDQDGDFNSRAFRIVPIEKEQ